MAQIFISHSSLDHDLVDKFVDLLQTGLGIHGKDTIFASSIPGKDIRMGIVNDEVKKELLDAKLVIFVLSLNFLESSYCWVEVGAALAADRDMFLLTTQDVDRKELSAVFEGYQVEKIHTKGSLAKLASVIDSVGITRTGPGTDRWEAKRDGFLKRLAAEHRAAERRRKQIKENIPGWKDRGYWSGSIVDGSLYIGSGYVTEDAKKEIARTIERGKVLPTVYAYLTSSGYQNWVSLTDDQSYGYYRDSLTLFTKKGDDLADKIKTAVGTDELDLISLGPGDGRKDVVLLRALTKVFDPDALYFYPFDVNASMIAHAMTAITKVKRLRKVRAKAILADLASLPEFSGIYQYRKAPNVLSLIGNTLGNLPEDQAFIEQLYSNAMGSGDLLLLEVRKNQDTDPELLKTEANKEFDLGPLEILGVPLDPDKIHYRAIEDLRFSPIPKTKTIISTYEAVTLEKKFKDVRLGLIREYDHDALSKVCKDIGFEVLSDPEYDSSVALLLRK
ncbi:MAG TPA: L-histidine N(alpha)-methyltransferase [Solirubrobacterales bacterium]|nr:L-histidine N(alpha)-methyltransferase [Solirubrobacterales bacterium]